MALSKADLAGAAKDTLESDLPLTKLLLNVDNSIRDETQSAIDKYQEADIQSSAATAAIKASANALEFAAKYLDGSIATDITNFTVVANNAATAKIAAVSTANSAYDELSAARSNLAATLAIEYVKLAKLEALDAAANIASGRLDVALETLFASSVNLGQLDRTQSINKEILDAVADVSAAQLVANDAQALADTYPTNLLLGTEAALAEQLLANAVANQSFATQLLGLFTSSRDTALANAEDAQASADAASAAVSAARSDVDEAVVAADSALANSIAAGNDYNVAQAALSGANAELLVGRAAAQAQIDVAVDFAFADAKSAALLAQSAAQDAADAAVSAKTPSEETTFDVDAVTAARDLAVTALNTATVAKNSALAASERATSSAAIGDKLDHIALKSAAAVDYADAAVLAFNGATTSLALAEAYLARAETFQVANGGNPAGQSRFSDDTEVGGPSSDSISQDGLVLGALVKHNAIEDALNASNWANGVIGSSFNTAIGSQEGLGGDRSEAESSAVASALSNVNLAQAQATIAATHAASAVAASFALCFSAALIASCAFLSAAAFFPVSTMLLFLLK